VAYRLAPESRGTALAEDVYCAVTWLREHAGELGVAGDRIIFRDEDLAYAAKLASSGVPIELHVHPGAPHGFDRLAPGAAVTRRAFTDRIRAIASL
jgi:acetyl esterase/lipase